MANIFGRVIRRARQQQGYTLGDFAAVAGVSTAYLSLIENGERPPPVDSKIAVMAILLNMEPDDLMYLAKRLPADVQKIVKEQPQDVAVLLRKFLKNP